MFYRKRCFGVLSMLFVSAGISAQDAIFNDGFEDARPATDAIAARFLTQATFGPNPAAIAELRTLGFEAWFAQQQALAPTLHRPALEAEIAAELAVNPQLGAFYRRHRLEKWWSTANTADDQLRQRVAYSLSQIFVISDQSGGLNQQPTQIAEFQDILVRNSLGSYRTLLEDVTRSPMMGIYLTHLRNLKTDWTLVNNVLTPSAIQPDENYAREIMQLFSVGLLERNLDFTPILAGGNPLQTYTQETITQTARVLTGLAYRCTPGTATIGGFSATRNCNCTGSACNFSTNLFFSRPPNMGVAASGSALMHPDAYSPMVCYPRYADTGRSATAANNYAVLPAPDNIKTIIAGVTVQPSTVACHSGTTGADQQSCINYCDDQIDRLLDALYLHPNTPPMVARQLIQRLVTSTPTGPYIERVARVFENDGTGTRGNLAAVVKAVLMDAEARNAPGANFGKLREPILRVTALFRAFGAQPGSTGGTRLTSPETSLLQRPLGAPSVFNFYEPDYQAPGEITQLGLFSPELQITSESTTVSVADQLYGVVFAGYSTASATQTPFSLPVGVHLPPAVIDALPTDATQLVDLLNTRLMYGAMSSTMRGKLISLLTGPMASADARRKALSTIHLILISPEFAAQR